MRKIQKGVIFLPILIIVLLLGVVGYVIYQNYNIKQQVPQAQPIPAANTVTPTTSSTDDWKVYSNTKFNYEVKYPSTWKFKESKNISSDYVSFLSSEDNDDPTGTIGIQAERINTQISTDADSLKQFETFMDSCSTQTPTQCTQKTSDDYEFKKQIRIAGKLAFQTYGGCCMEFGRHIFLYHNTNSYRFTLYNLGPNTSGLKNEDVFNQILSTFKFADQSNSEISWETYSNNKHFYSLQHPDDWKVFENTTSPSTNYSPYTSIVKGNLDVGAAINILVEDPTDPESFIPKETYIVSDMSYADFGNQPAIFVSFKGIGQQTWIFIPQFDKTYIINYYGTSEDFKVIEQILSTFKFSS